MDGWILLATLAGIAFAAGFIHSAIGFGFGIVAISLLPLVIDVRSSHVVVSISSVPMLMMAAWAYRHGHERSSLKQALLGAAIFLPLGLALFYMASLDWLVRGTGIAIAAMVLFDARKRSLDQPKKAWKYAGFSAGAVAGFLGGAVSIAGPPVAAYALKQDWTQARYKAFITQCLLVISIYKAILLAANGSFVGDAVLHTAVVATLSIAGVQLGAMLSAKIPAANFKRLVAISLLLVAAMMIWRGQPSTDPAPIREGERSVSR